MGDGVVLYWTIMGLGVVAYPVGRLMAREVGGVGRAAAWLAAGVVSIFAPMALCPGGCQGAASNALCFLPIPCLFAGISVMAGFGRSGTGSSQTRRPPGLTYKGLLAGAMAGFVAALLAYWRSGQDASLLALPIGAVIGGAFDFARRHAGLANSHDSKKG